MRIGIFGGTGPAGTALGARLASVGYDIVLGSRSKYCRAMEARDHIVAAWPDAASCRSTPATTTPPPNARLIVIAAVGLRCHDRKASTSPSWPGRSSSRWRTRSCGSVPEFSRSCREVRSLPTCRWRCPAAGSSLRSTICRQGLSNLDHSIDSDVLICSDYADAIKDVSEIVRKIPGCGRSMRVSCPMPPPSKPSPPSCCS